MPIAPDTVRSGRRLPRRRSKRINTKRQITRRLGGETAATHALPRFAAITLTAATTKQTAGSYQQSDDRVTAISDHLIADSYSNSRSSRSRPSLNL